MSETLPLLLLAVLQPLSAFQQSSGRQPVAPASNAEPIRIGGGVPRDSMILGETPIAPPGFTATGWSLIASSGIAPCTSIAGMPNPRTQAPAVDANGKIYIVGGYVQSGAVAVTVDEYDPLTDSWTTKQAAMPTPRIAHAAAAVNGRIFVLGGVTGPQFNLVTGSVEEYDPVTDQWHSRAPMPTPRQTIPVAVLGETIYALGGIGADITALASVEAYNTATGTWQVRAPMPVASHSFSATSLGGKIYVFSGPTYEYDPVMDTWTVRTSTCPGGWATSWNDRVFLVAGSSVNEYDPVSNVFTNRGLFTTFKNSAAFARLEDKIFSFGGTSSVQPVPSEQFDLSSWRTLYVHRKN